MSSLQLVAARKQQIISPNRVVSSKMDEMVNQTTRLEAVLGGFVGGLQRVALSSDLQFLAGRGLSNGLTR